MTRFKGRSPVLRAGMLAVVFAATAGIADRSPARADDVTPERLLMPIRRQATGCTITKIFRQPGSLA